MPRTAGLFRTRSASHRLLVLAAAAASAALTAIPCSADDTEYRWTSPVSGSWSDGDRWTPTGYPGYQYAYYDSAIIDAEGADYTISYELNQRIGFALTNLLLDSADATLVITAPPGERNGVNAKQLVLERGHLSVGGNVSLGSKNIIHFNGGHFSADGSDGTVSIAGKSLTNSADFHVAAGNAVEFHGVESDPRVPDFVNTSSGTLRLDGPLVFRGEHFRNEGNITGDGGVHVYAGVVVQGSAPSIPGGRFVLYGESFFEGGDPSLNQVFAGQTLAIQHNRDMQFTYPITHVRDGFRNKGTLIMESLDADYDVFLQAGRPPQAPFGEPGTIVNAGGFVTNPGVSGVGKRVIDAVLVNESTGTITLNANTQLSHGLTNFGRIKLAQGVTLETGWNAASASVFAQKAGVLEGSGTINMDWYWTFLNEGGIIEGNPVVRFPHHGTLINDIEDNGAATFVFEGGNSRIGRSASGKVLIGEGQTVHIMPNSFGVTADFGMTNAGTLILEGPFYVMDSAEGTRDRVLTNTGTILVPEGVTMVTLPTAVVNSPTGTLNIARRLVDSFFELQNAGVINVEPDGGFRVSGPTLNSGTIVAAGLQHLSDLTNAGTFSVGGRLTITGMVTNTGELRASNVRGEVWKDLQNEATITIENRSVMTVRGTVVNAGTLSVAGASELTLEGSAVNTGTLSVTSGGVLKLYTSKRITNMGELHLAGGTIDLRHGELVNPYADAAERDAALAKLTDLVRSARNWEGHGITSSALRVHETLAVGTIDDAVVVRVTYNGDANLDGIINADDYFRIDSGFLAQPADPLFSQGDFNYDGLINADDYFLIDSAFLGQGQPLGGLAEASAFSTAPVPEPGGLFVIVAAITVLAHRRSRA